MIIRYELGLVKHSIKRQIWTHRLARSQSPSCSQSLRYNSSLFQAQPKPTTTSSTSSLAPPAEIIVSGIQPTGQPHLGNYLGALKQWVTMQNTAGPKSHTKLLYSIVDLHAITMYQSPQLLRRSKRECLRSLLAIGIDPQRSVVFQQSMVPEHTELMWILSCVAPMQLLERQTQYKSKAALSSKKGLPAEPTEASKLKLGLFSYPVLQAADILLYRATKVPVGEDQAQHLELARDLAGKMNRNFPVERDDGTQEELFPIPETILTSAKRIMSLASPTSKMSKSDPNVKSHITIFEEPKAIQEKIAKAVTDSIAGVTYDAVNRPGVANLLEIMGHMTNRQDFEQLARENADLSMREFKARVCDSIVEGLREVRERYKRVENEGERYLEDVERMGAKRAGEMATETLDRVRISIGLR